MKTSGKTLLVAALIAVLNFDGIEGSATAADSYSTAALQLLIEAVRTTMPLPASEVPECGTFWSAQFGTDRPPLPGNTLHLPAGRCSGTTASSWMIATSIMPNSRPKPKRWS